MKKQAKISNAVIKRLPRYRRYLKELRKKGVDKISSNEFSTLIGYTASQIRQDLNNFGGFGQQGYGYSVDRLYHEISAILGLDKQYKMVVVGAGNLGQAIVNHTYYYKSGFIVSAIFEVNPKLIGLKINDIEVMDYENIVEYEENRNRHWDHLYYHGRSTGGCGQIVFRRCERTLEFCPGRHRDSGHVAIENVHLTDSLYSLAYHINGAQEHNKK